MDAANLIGPEPQLKSPAMQRVFALVERAAAVDTALLITGETGSGKEHLARYIHARSRRAKGPFMPVHCGALPDTLLESELFGHVKGAFTGAYADHVGLFEAAGGGTLFLDEIGDTSLSFQVKLLRVLEDHVVRPLGSTKGRSTDVRVVAATHRDLDTMVAQGEFREDLYYRLKVIVIAVPPVRERREDILGLAQAFVSRVCRTYGCGPCFFTPEALDDLMAYSWPGNVRELENAIERAVVLAQGQPKITRADLPPEVRGELGTLSRPGFEEEVLPLREMEKRYILRTLERLGGNRKETARALGIGTTTLWRKLRAYGLVG